VVALPLGSALLAVARADVFILYIVGGIAGIQLVAVLPVRVGGEPLFH